jgi:hypothetical protein
MLGVGSNDPSIFLLESGRVFSSSLAGFGHWRTFIPAQFPYAVDRGKKLCTLGGTYRRRINEVIAPIAIPMPAVAPS